MEFRRHITFCRTYKDDSGMPEWPRGSRRAVCFRFDSFVTERDFVMHMLHNPSEFEPYLDAPPLHLRHVITAPTWQGTAPPLDTIEFSRWVRSDHADHASIRSEWRNDDLGAITRSLIVDNAFRLSATFPIYDDASIANFCRWIVERRFNGFQHKDAAIRFSAFAVPPHTDFSAPATTTHRGNLYQPHPLARPISNPFAADAAAVDDDGAVRPASPAGNEVGNSDNSESEPEPDDVLSVSEQEGDAEGDASDDEGVPQPDPDPDPEPQPQPDDDDDWGEGAVEVLQHRGPEYFPQRALRRISDELFDVRQEMPEAVYVRLSNSLKRRLGE